MQATLRFWYLRIGAFVAAALLSYGAAQLAASWMESRSVSLLESALDSPRYEFVSLEADGLQVMLTGEAPDEATRFQVLSMLGGLIAPDRLVDAMDVAASTDLAPLRFSIEMLRNGDGISLIGLIPADPGRNPILNELEGLPGDPEITDLMETADHAVAEGWEEAVDFAMSALRDLPRSKISVSAEQVEISALADSPEEKTRFETRLARAAPDSVRLLLDIAAPRPVITPFTLRFTHDGESAAFDACSADTEAAQRQILAAAAEAGLTGKALCTIGLGVPSPRWSEAAALGIAAVQELGGGTLTFSDADVSLVALDTTEQALFDRVIGELEADLPEVFSLEAVLPKPVRVDGTGGTDEIPEFVATLSPEGLVQLRGRVSDEIQRTAVNSFAQALFGSDQVVAAARLDAALPDDWPVRVLAGLEALGKLHNGSLVVQPDYLRLRGVTGDIDASSEVARLLSARLESGADLELDIRYAEELDPANALPTPEECAAKVNAALAEEKITFDPGSATIASEAQPLVDKIADIVRTCETVQMEIAGHTDSQGREEMNLRLSQARAEAVLTALLDRRVLTTNLSAKGYGETRPIAENDTEEGREANRRIEFRVVLPGEEPPVDETATDETDAPQEAESQDE